MICRLRVIVALAALLIGASFAPTGAQAHLGHNHAAAAVKQKALSLELKSVNADQSALPRGRATFAKVPLKPTPSAPVACNGLCCLCFGLSCCSAAIAPQVEAIVLPLWNRVGFYRPPVSPHPSINPSGPARPPRPFV